MAPRKRRCATWRTVLSNVRYRSRLFAPSLAASIPQLLTHLRHRLMRGREIRCTFRIASHQCDFEDAAKAQHSGGRGGLKTAPQSA